MRRVWLVGLVAAAACGGASPSGNQSAETTTSVVAAPPAYEPLYAEAPCPAGVPSDPRVTCGVLTVPEDRSKPTGRTVRLPVARLRSAAAAPAPDPIIYFSGGPGYSGMSEAGFFLEEDFGGRRDVILFDQRGTGTSEPSLDCPEVHEAVATVFGAAASYDEEAGLAADALMACHDRLAAEGVDFDQYDTSATADDVADLKRAMGIDEWNLFGVSYGTTVALAVLRAHPEGVRSVVIDSVYPTTVPGGLLSDTANLERVLGVFYAGCAATPECAAAYPMLSADVDGLVASMNATPYRGHITNTVLGREQDIVITGSDVLTGLFQAFYDADVIPQLPSIVQLVKAGGGGPVIDQLAVEGIAFTNGAAEAETAAVECADRQRLNDPEADAAFLAEHPEYSTFGLLDTGVCAAFGVESVPESFNEPVKSALPALVLGNEYDPVTPPGDSEDAAGALSASTFVLFPGLGHGAVFSHPCPVQIFQAFMDDPTAEVDTACVAAMGPPAWVVPG